MYLTNCWYAAAWNEDLTDSTPLERQICGEKLVLFRRADRSIAALAGVCPHRFASLARGKVLESGHLQCPYHGLQFDASGRCVHNPLPFDKGAVFTRRMLADLVAGKKHLQPTSLRPQVATARGAVISG